MTTLHPTSSKSKDFVLYRCCVFYNQKDGQFYWDEDTLNTKELIKVFTEKYGVPVEKHSKIKRLNIALPHVLKALVVHLKNEFKHSYDSSRKLLDNLIT